MEPGGKTTPSMDRKDPMPKDDYDVVEALCKLLEVPEEERDAEWYDKVFDIETHLDETAGGT